MTGKGVIRVHVQRGILFALRRLGLNLLYPSPGSVRKFCSRLLSQSIAIDEWFLCGYRLFIDWPTPIGTNQLIFSIDIYSISDHRFLSIGYPGILSCHCKFRQRHEVW